MGFVPISLADHLIRQDRRRLDYFVRSMEYKTLVQDSLVHKFQHLHHRLFRGVNYDGIRLHRHLQLEPIRLSCRLGQYIRLHHHLQSNQ